MQEEFFEEYRADIYKINCLECQHDGNFGCMCISDANGRTSANKFTQFMSGILKHKWIVCKNDVRYLTVLLLNESIYYKISNYIFIIVVNWLKVSCQSFNHCMQRCGIYWRVKAMKAFQLYDKCLKIHASKCFHYCQNVSIISN